MQAYISQSLSRPITRIDTDLVDYIVASTGIEEATVQEILIETYPNGSIGSFMTKYFEMAFNGRDEATEFEEATAKLFSDVFGFETKHVGPIGLTPDVLLISKEANYQAIIDNKAYRKYSISNDHHNRMVYNYIPRVSEYGDKDKPLAFYSYIAGGFSNNIDSQIQSINQVTDVCGSAISVSNVIKMVERNQCKPYTHADIKNILGCNRQILLKDIV